MAALSITATPASGISANTVFRFDVAGTTPNDNTAYNGSNYPAEPETRFYLAYEVGGKEMGRSQVFGTTPDGAFQVNGYIFPTSGTWTVNLRKVSDDSSVITATVVVA